MLNLYEFDSASTTTVPICIIDGTVQSMNSDHPDVRLVTNTIDKHPIVHITREMIHPVKSGEEGKALFLPVTAPFLKQLTQSYIEQGLLETIQVASRRKHFFLSKCATIILKLHEQFNRLMIVFKPHLQHSANKLINDISQTRNWETNIIRCVAWHPYCTKVAVATCDDSVRVFIGDSTVAPLLKCKQQQNITCLAWRPLSSSEIAVGCETGIFIWNVDPNTVVTRPSSSSAIILQRVSHHPVISVSWGPRGDILVSSAICDGTILIWDVEMNRTSALKRPGAPGNTIVAFSPKGEKMFSASVDIIFRVWDCQTWQAERWNVPSGRVQAACWSPCGQYLLFATNEEPTIYGLTFANANTIFSTDEKSTPSCACPVFDLTKVDLNGDVVGGLVQNMVWDSKGKHLAVLFQDSNYVALFSTSSKPTLSIMPCSLIPGLAEEIPTVIAFQKNFGSGSCLSIGWSSGRLQHFPIIYSDLLSLNDSLINPKINASYTSSGRQSLF